MDTPSPTLTPDQIRDLRHRAGVNCKTVYTALYRSRYTWHRWETGKLPMPPDAIESYLNYIEPLIEHNAALTQRIDHLFSSQQ